MEIQPFEAEREVGKHEVVMYIEIVLRLIIDVNFELRDFIFGFRDDKEVVCWKDFEIIALVVFVLGVRLRLGMDVDIGTAYVF